MLRVRAAIAGIGEDRSRMLNATRAKITQLNFINSVASRRLGPFANHLAPGEGFEPPRPIRATGLL